MITSISVIVIPLFSAAVSLWGIYKNNRTKLASDIIAKSRLDWINLIENNTADLITAIEDLNGFLYNSTIDYETKSLVKITQYIDVYHDKEINVKKAGSLLKLDLLSYADETDTIEGILIQLEDLLKEYNSKMDGTPGLVLVAQSLKEQYKKIEMFVDPQMSDKNYESLWKSTEPFEKPFKNNQQLLDDLIGSITKLLGKERIKAFNGK